MIAERPRAYSYIRMSTDIQLKGDSLRRQLEASEKFAGEHNLELVEDFNLRDIGVSAFKGKNIVEGKLGTFIQAVENGDIDRGSYLLVESLDRLSRQETFKSLKLFLEILDLGVNIATLSDGFVFKSDNVNEMQLMMSILIMSRAHEESQIKKSHRIGAAWANKRKDGSVKLTKTCPAWLELNEDRKSFTVLRDKSKIVKRIFQLAADGYGNSRIAKRFNTEGVPTLGRSKGWYTSTIDKTLKNRAVLGEFQPHKLVDRKRVPEGDPIPGYFPKIIDETLFYEVEAARQLRKISGSGRKGKFNSNLFSGIAKCGYCGAPMQYVDKGKGPKGGQYLVCSDAQRGLPCINKGWRYKDFEELFLTYVEELDLKKILAGKQDNTELKALEDRLVILKGELSSKQEEQERVYQLFIDGGSSSDFVASKLSDIGTQITELENQISQIGERIEIARSQDINQSKSSEHLAQLLNALKTEDGNLEDLRTRLSASIKSIVTSLELFREGMTPIKRTEIRQPQFHEAEQDEFLSAMRFEEGYLKVSDRPFFIVRFGETEYRKVSVDLTNPRSRERLVEVSTQNVWSRYQADGTEHHLRKQKQETSN
ncbi:MAG: recombinase family protein [Pseudomonadota bacterium]